MRTASFVVLAALGLTTACYNMQVDDEPNTIINNGDRVREDMGPVRAARHQYEQDAAAADEERGAIMADAMSTCAPALCEAIARGEVVLGMTESQVLAATGTTTAAWQVRDAGGATVYVPAFRDDPPADRVADLAIVQLHDGRVSSYSYREAAGIRVVSNPADATTEGRADALADMLIREGDDYAARGEFESALNRYDRADILRPTDPMIEYRIATVLDKWSRPIEAQIRYQLFLHELQLERIDAVGRVYANIAEAEAYARARILNLEHHQY